VVGSSARRRAFVRLSLIGAAVASLTATAAPASAHALPNPAQSRYRAAVTSVRPARPGLDVAPTGDGMGLKVSWTGSGQVVVYGYGGDEYLRIGPTGVDENVLSPSVRLNSNEPLSDAADYPHALEPAQWRHVSAEHLVQWYDQRLAWLGPPPAAVLGDLRHPHQVKTWTLTLVVRGVPTEVTGTLTWVPPRSGSGTALAVELGAQVVAVGVVGLFGWRHYRRRRPVQDSRRLPPRGP
jgi:hypothetical protein